MQPPGVLADALFELRKRAAHRKIERALEDELRRRMGTRERTRFAREYDAAAGRARAGSGTPTSWKRRSASCSITGTVHAGELTEVISDDAVSAGRRLCPCSASSGRARRCRALLPLGDERDAEARRCPLGH